MTREVGAEGMPAFDRMLGAGYEMKNQLMHLPYMHRPKKLTQSSQVGHPCRTSVSTGTEARSLLSSSRCSLNEQYTVRQLETVQTGNGHLGHRIINVFAESETLWQNSLISMDITTVIPGLQLTFEGPV
jgi:hypothetical protein